MFCHHGSHSYPCICASVCVCVHVCVTLFGLHPHLHVIGPLARFFMETITTVGGGLLTMLGTFAMEYCTCTSFGVPLFIPSLATKVAFVAVLSCTVWRSTEGYYSLCQAHIHVHVHVHVMVKRNLFKHGGCGLLDKGQDFRRQRSISFRSIVNFGNHGNGHFPLDSFLSFLVPLLLLCNLCLVHVNYRRTGFNCKNLLIVSCEFLLYSQLLEM